VPQMRGTNSGSKPDCVGGRAFIAVSEVRRPWVLCETVNRRGGIFRATKETAFLGRQSWPV